VPMICHGDELGRTQGGNTESVNLFEARFRGIY